MRNVILIYEVQFSHLENKKQNLFSAFLLHKFVIREQC